MRPYRKQRLASVIRDIVSEAILHHLNDPRVDPLTSITRVEMSPDLLIAKIYLSVPGGEIAERKSLTAIRHAAKHIQRMVARELTTRNCPELRFDLDGTTKIAQDTLSLIEANKKEYAARNPEELDPQEAVDPDDPTHIENRNTNIENDSTTEP